MPPAPPPIVIAGCGRLGSNLATRLDRCGHVVRLVDRDAASLAILPTKLAATAVAGEVLRLQVLRQTGLRPGGLLLAVTASDDLNLALGLICRRLFGIKEPLARVQDPVRAAAYRRLGIGAVCPTTAVTAVLLERMSGGNMRSLYVVVVGCGRLGSHLAGLLSHGGHRVVIIDRNEASFAKLADEVYSGFRIEGDASEPAVLREAKLEQADLLIAATHEDNVNLMVALVAKQVFGVKHVMARVYDPAREEIYRDLGLETICPTLIAGDAFLRLVRRAVGDLSGEE